MSKKRAKPRRVFDVMPDGDDWIVRERAPRSGNFTDVVRKTHRFDRKKDAVPDGIKIARAAAPSSLVIHKQDGTIQEERTYGGGDPFPPRG